jgi:hypothetical protein
MIKHDNYNCCITTQDGQEHLVYASWLHNEKLDCWQGYHCDAGNTRFHIDKNFDIWSGECKNDYLGNMLGGWSPKADVICKQTTCSGCTDDLMVKKYLK